MSLRLQVAANSSDLLRHLREQLRAAQQQAAAQTAGVPPPIPVLVPTPIMADWLQVQLARHFGLSMGFEFVPPATYVRRRFTATPDGVRFAEASAFWAPENLAWRLLPHIDRVAFAATPESGLAALNRIRFLTAHRDHRHGAAGLNAAIRAATLSEVERATLSEVEWAATRHLSEQTVGAALRRDGSSPRDNAGSQSSAVSGSRSFSVSAFQSALPILIDRNDPETGLALTPDAHWSFDEGLSTIDDDYRVIIARGRFTESSPTNALLARCHGQPLFFHPAARLRPSRDFLADHRQCATGFS